MSDICVQLPRPVQAFVVGAFRKRIIRGALICIVLLVVRHMIWTQSHEWLLFIIATEIPLIIIGMSRLDEDSDWTYHLSDSALNLTKPGGFYNGSLRTLFTADWNRFVINSIERTHFAGWPALKLNLVEKRRIESGNFTIAKRVYLAYLASDETFVLSRVEPILLSHQLAQQQLK